MRSSWIKLRDVVSRSWSRFLLRGRVHCSFTVRSLCAFVCSSCSSKSSRWSKQRCPSFWSWWPCPLRNTSLNLARGSLRPYPEVCEHRLPWGWMAETKVLYDEYWGNVYVCPGWGDQLIWAQTYEEALYWARLRWETVPPLTLSFIQVNDSI